MKTLGLLLLTILRAAFEAAASILLAKQAGRAEERERQAREQAEAERKAASVREQTTDDTISNLDRGTF
jgi:Ni/Co efflux regulator RcnB